MTRVVVTVLIGLTLAGAGCNSVTRSSPVSVVSTEFAQALSSVDESMIKTRVPLEFESGKAVVNCAEYLRVARDSTISESVTNRDAMAEYLVCDSLVLIESHHWQTTTVNEASPIVSDLRQRLDLGSFASSLAQLADEHPTLAELPVMPSRVDGASVIAESDDWTVELQVIAWAQSAGQGCAIVWMHDTARDGTYRDHAVLLVPLRAGGGVMAAQRVTGTTLERTLCPPLKAR